MPQIGWFEILIIVVLSILIIGPKDFPLVLKKIGSWVATFKNYFSEAQRTISNIDNTIEDETYKKKDLSNLANHNKKDE